MEIKMEAENRNRSGWFDKNSSKGAKDEESVNMFDLMNKISQQTLKAKSKPTKRGAASDRESDYDTPSKFDPVKKKSTKKETKPKPPKSLPESDEESVYDRFPKKEEEMFKKSKNREKKSKPKKSGTDSTEVDDDVKLGQNKYLKPSMRKVKKRPGLKSADQKDDEWVNMYDVLGGLSNRKPNRGLEENDGESTPVKAKPKKKEKKPKPPKSAIESPEESDYDTGTVSKSDTVNKPPKKKEKKPKFKPVSSDSGEESNTYDLDEREPPVKKKPKTKGKKTPDSDGGAGSEWVNMHDLMNRIAQQKLEPKSKPRSRVPDSRGKSGAVTPSKMYPVSKKSEKKDKKPKSKNVSSDSGEESEPISKKSQKKDKKPKSTNVSSGSGEESEPITKKSKKKEKKPKSKNVSSDSGDESDNISRDKSGLSSKSYKKPSEPPVAYSYAIVPPDQRKEAAPISIATTQNSKPPSKQPSDSFNKKPKKKGMKSKTEEKPKPKKIESSSESDSAGLNKSDMLSQKPRPIENESPVASRSYIDYINQYCYDGGGNVQTRPPQPKCPRHKLRENNRTSVRDQGNQQSCDDLFEALNKQQPIERVEYTGGNYNQDVFNQGNVFMKKTIRQERKIPSQAFRGGGKDDQAVSMLDLLNQAVKSSQETTPKPKTLTNEIFDADSGKGDSLSNKSKRSKKQLPVETDSGKENEDFELSQNVSEGQQSRRSQKAPSSVSSKNSKISKKSAKGSKGQESPEEAENDPCKTTGAVFLRFVESLGTNKYMCERITEDCQPVCPDASVTSRMTGKCQDSPASFYCGDTEECCEPVKFEDMFGLSFPHFTVAIVVILCGAALYRHLNNCYFVVVVVFSIIIFTAYKKYAKRFKGQN